MTILTLVRRNLIHFWQTNLAVVAGVTVAVAVLAGALLVGTSVRTSLRSLALERLGAVDQVVTSSNFVPEALADDLLASGTMPQMFAAAAPLIEVEGFVIHQESGRRASAVQVYGVDDRFWDFHGRAPEGRGPERSGVLISQGLARELEAEADHTLLVRVEMPSAIPISSLHGRREDVGRSLRLRIAQVLDPKELGEFSFRPHQGLARSVFVSLTRLQQELEQDGRVNTVLLGDSGSRRDDDVDSAASRLASAEAAVRDVASLEDLGLRVRALTEQHAIAVEAEAGLINDATVDAVSVAADGLGLRVQPVMTYLANQLRLGDRVTPYSLVTALDLSVVTPIGQPGSGPEAGLSPVVLNTWAAEDLDAQVGDLLEIEYYVWEDEGRLAMRETQLQVTGVVPIEGAAGDRDLAPDYPGITETNDLIGWDPPFEIDLDLIRQKDEDYWDEYRTTPKAFIPLETGQRLWGTRWGRHTSVRLIPEGAELDASVARFRAAFEPLLDPLAIGFVVYPARALALEASAGATDFGLYFIYFSFFLVVSALLLASLFFRLGVEQRLREIGVLRATGFPAGRGPQAVLGRGAGALDGGQRSRHRLRDRLRRAGHVGAQDLVGRCRWHDPPDPSHCLAAVDRWGGGRCAGSLRFDRLGPSLAHPCLSPQLAVGSPAGGKRGAGARPDRHRRPPDAGSGCWGRHGHRRHRGRSVRVARSTGCDGGVLHGRVAAALCDASLYLGLAHSPSAPTHERSLVLDAGRLPQRDLSPRSQRAVHRADRLRGVHHRCRRRVPSRRSRGRT